MCAHRSGAMKPPLCQPGSLLVLATARWVCCLDLTEACLFRPQGYCTDWQGWSHGGEHTVLGAGWPQWGGVDTCYRQELGESLREGRAAWGKSQREGLEWAAQSGLMAALTFRRTYGFSLGAMEASGSV